MKYASLKQNLYTGKTVWGYIEGSEIIITNREGMSTLTDYFDTLVIYLVHFCASCSFSS